MGHYFVYCVLIIIIIIIIMKDDIFMVLKCTYVKIRFLEQIVVMWNLHKTSIENMQL